MNVRGAARREVKLDLREIINSEGEILFQSMNTRASLHSAKACFRIYNFSAWLADEHVIIDRKEKATSKTSI